MVLNLSLQFADLVLQLPASAFEGIIDREGRIGMPLIILPGMANIDFAALWQCEPDADLVQAALVVMVAWRLEHHPAGSDPAKASLKLGKVLDDCAADVGVRVHALKIDLDGSFHIITGALQLTKSHTEARTFH
ncbi:MAG: hypothetical protein WB489_03180 [Pseudolabrys sp.]